MTKSKHSLTIEAFLVVPFFLAAIFMIFFTINAVIDADSTSSFLKAHDVSETLRAECGLEKLVVLDKDENGESEDWVVFTAHKDGVPYQDKLTARLVGVDVVITDDKQEVCSIPAELKDIKK